MAINGKHTTEVMIFPRVCRGARRGVCLRACASVYTCTGHTRRRVLVCRPLRGGEGEEGVVSTPYARESLPPNKDARFGLLNATSACSSLVRKGIYLSIHLLGGGGCAAEVGGSEEEEGGY